MYTGPNLIKQENLVFGFDTGYGVADNTTSTRFYPGESTDNKLRLFTSNTLSNPTNIYRVTVTEQNTVDSSAPNGQYSRYTGVDGSDNNQVFYSYAGSGFNYTGQTITYSVYLKGSGTCHLTTYDNQSGYGTSGTITLTNEWVRYSYTRTVNGSASNHWSGVRGILSSTDVYVAASQMEIKGHATPFTPTTRSSTASLIDLKKNNNIDMSYMSFDSTSQPTFDGTDDYILTPFTRGTLGDELTMIAYYKFDGSASRTYTPIFGGKESGAGTEFFIGKNSGNTHIGVQDGNYIGTFVQGSNAWDGNYHQIVYTYQNGSGKIYLDAVLKNTGTFTKCNTAEQITVGSEVEGSGYYMIGDIPRVCVFDRVLTADEVLKDFNANKNRFNI